MPNTDSGEREVRLVVVSGGTSNPSTTRMLADRVAETVATIAREREARVSITTIDLRELATEITAAIVSGLRGPALEAASTSLGEADGVIASTPVYKAEASGLFSSFFHVLDGDLLIGKPVVLAATAGTARHALVVDGQLRSLFAFLRTLTTPTSLFATTADMNDAALTARIKRAALELWLLVDARFTERLREESWSSYQHDFGSAGGTNVDVDFDSDLMRLATGGSLVDDRA